MTNLPDLINESGCFPTIGERTGIVESPFLHGFVLEHLIDNRSPKNIALIHRGLNFTTSQAEYNGMHWVWRWVQHPPDPAQKRSPDTDTTMRCRVVIEKAHRHGLHVPEHLAHFDYEAYLVSIMDCSGAVQTYPTRPGTTCPEVNIQALYALNQVEGYEVLKRRLCEYIRRVVQTDYFTGDGHKKNSKYYFSPFYGLHLLHTINLDSIMEERIRQLAQSNIPHSPLDKIWRRHILGETEMPVNMQETTPIFRSQRPADTYSSPSFLTTNF